MVMRIADEEVTVAIDAQPARRAVAVIGSGPTVVAQFAMPIVVVNAGRVAEKVNPNACLRLFPATRSGTFSYAVNKAVDGSGPFGGPGDINDPAGHACGGRGDSNNPAGACLWRAG